MSQTKLYIFHVPRLFHMAYSPLGRLIRDRVPDMRRAENGFILSITAILMVLMFLNQVAWAFVGKSILADPEGPIAMKFWIGQLAFFMAFCFGCGIGFKPAFTLTCSRTVLRIQGEHLIKVIAYRDIESIETISALTYHRHYRRYARTESFVNQIGDELLLIHTTSDPVILGLEAGDREACQAYLESQLHEATILDLEPAQVA